MHLKITLLNVCTIISLATTLPAPARNGLLRTPKVYNAVITTDDNLAPSRAFPIIQPYIHEQPIAFSSFNGITSFGHPFSRFYDYSNFHGNLGYAGIQNIPRSNEKIQSRSKEVPAVPAKESGEVNISKATLKLYDSNPETTLPNKPEVSNESFGKENLNEPQPQQQQQQNEEKSPIPLNEFGLPPSLVPFSSYDQPIPSYINNPYNLQPYQHQSYPLIYDSFNGYQANPLLPPFSFYPPSSDGAGQIPSDIYEDNFQKGRSLLRPSAEQSILGLETKDDDSQPQSSQSNAPKQNLPPPLQPLSTGDVINYANKNKNIPDVPPPPLPTSRKSQ